MNSVERYLPHLSERALRWVRFLGVLLAIAVVFWMAYRLREILNPIFVALAIAYIFNPAVTRLERFGVRRVTTIAVLYVIGTLLLAALSFFLFRQVLELQANIPGYFGRAQRWFTSSQPAIFGYVLTSRPAVMDEMDAEHVEDLVRQHGVALVSRLVNTTASLLSDVMYWLTIFVLIPLYTFFFLLRFNDIATAVRDHIPFNYRETTLRVAHTIDAAIASFFRGRLIVCLIIGTLLCIGWFIVGVRYSIPLGIIGGLLSIVPFLPLVVLPPALFFAYVDAAAAGENWVWPVVFAAGVYFLVQAIESFVLAPLISGKTAGLHPVAVVVVLLIGAQVAGLLGMLLAIPIASTLKTLGAEWILPEIRRLAAAPPKPAHVGPEPPTAIAIDKVVVPSQDPPTTPVEPPQ